LNVIIVAVGPGTWDLGPGTWGRGVSGAGGRSGGLLLAGAGPVDVVRAVGVHPPVCLRTEQVSLPLHQGGRQSLGPQPVVVRERRTKSGYGNGGSSRRGHSAPPALLAGHHGVPEVVVEEEGRQVWPPLVRLSTPVKEPRPDDASAPPDGREGAKIDIPAVLVRAGSDHVEPLRVGDDLGRVQRLPDIVD